MSVVTMKQLLESGAHFGHQTRRWNPKMKPYIYATKNGSHILDLGITKDEIEVAYNKMKEIPDAKWDMKHPVKFDVEITDTNKTFFLPYLSEIAPNGQLTIH